MSTKGTVDKFIGDAVMGDVERRRWIPITLGLHRGRQYRFSRSHEFHCARRQGESGGTA
jgi:hypothetical protein